MIQKVEMYTVVCDNCKKDCNEGTDYSCWGDEEYAEEVAMESDWEKVDDKHYCTNCFEYNDDDELKIIESRFVKTPIE